MGIEQQEIQLWHEATVYNGHLRGPVTLTPVAER